MILRSVYHPGMSLRTGPRLWHNQESHCHPDPAFTTTRNGVSPTEDYESWLTGCISPDQTTPPRASRSMPWQLAEDGPWQRQAPVGMAG